MANSKSTTPVQAKPKAKAAPAPIVRPVAVATGHGAQGGSGVQTFAGATRQWRAERFRRGASWAQRKARSKTYCAPTAR